MSFVISTICEEGLTFAANAKLSVLLNRSRGQVPATCPEAKNQ